jgi:hypothetical protein
VLRDAAGVAVTGVALGAAGAWLLARSLSALQYGVSVGDPISWAVVLAFIAMTTIAASWRPAQQATRADPASLLRE